MFLARTGHTETLKRSHTDITYGQLTNQEAVDTRPSQENTN